MAHDPLLGPAERSLAQGSRSIGWARLRTGPTPSQTFCAPIVACACSVKQARAKHSGAWVRSAALEVPGGARRP